MKNIPEKFLNALKKLINKDSKESERLIEKLEKEPEQTAERIAHHIGTQTGPIKFK